MKTFLAFFLTCTMAFASPPPSADFDMDGDIDGNDFLIWQIWFGTGTTHGQGDADWDGDVDGADFLLWQAQKEAAQNGSQTFESSGTYYPHNQTWSDFGHVFLARFKNNDFEYSTGGQLHMTPTGTYNVLLEMQGNTGPRFTVAQLLTAWNGEWIACLVNKEGGPWGRADYVDISLNVPNVVRSDVGRIVRPKNAADHVLSLAPVSVTKEGTTNFITYEIYWAQSGGADMLKIEYWADDEKVGWATLGGSYVDGQTVARRIFTFDHANAGEVDTYQIIARIVNLQGDTMLNLEDTLDVNAPE